MSEMSTENLAYLTDCFASLTIHLKNCVAIK